LTIPTRVHRSSLERLAVAIPALAAMLAGQPAAAQTLPAATAAQTALPPDLPAADWREADPQDTIVYDTTKGRIVVELAPALAPAHAARIRELARAGFYDGLTFHRVIDGFMAQGGDPAGDGTGQSSLPDLQPEFTFRRGADSGYSRAVDRSGVTLGWIGAIPVSSQPDVLMTRMADRRVSAWANHCPGVASMARAQDPASANSQFFLLRAAYPSLDRNYTVWGRAVVGLDVIRSLKTGEPVVDPDRMLRVRVLADLPESERPRVFVQRTDGPAFQARLANALATAGATFSNCDLIPDGRLVGP
jgi:peptidylprolyl isomerase